MKKIKELIIYILSKECPTETKNLVYLFVSSTVVSLVALVASLIALFYSLMLL